MVAAGGGWVGRARRGEAVWGETGGGREVARARFGKHTGHREKLTFGTMLLPGGRLPRMVATLCAFPPPFSALSTFTSSGVQLLIVTLCQGGAHTRVANLHS